MTTRTFGEPAGRGLGPLVASHWARTIRQFLDHLDAHAPKPARRLHVVDIRPPVASGVLRMLRAIRSAGVDSARLRYHVCTHEGSLPPRWGASPLLAPWLRDGVLATLAWRPDDGLVDVERAPWLDEDAVVLMANDAWSRLDHRLFATHYGQFMEGDLLALTQAPHAAASAWKKVCDQPWGGPLQPVFERARQGLNSAPLPLPVGALKAIDTFIGPARDALVLAMDDGLATESAIRLAGFDPILAKARAHGYLPVNFHFLRAHLEQMGAEVWHASLAGGRVMQIAAKLGSSAEHRPCLPKWVPKPLEDPLDCASLAQAMKTIAQVGESSQALELLRHARFDPHVLNGAGFNLHRRLLAQSSCDRHAWRDALRQVWSHHFPDPLEAAFQVNLIAAAIQIEAWPLAREIIDSCLAFEPANEAMRLLGNWCAAKTGALAPAAIGPQDGHPPHASPYFADFAARLDAWAQRRACSPLATRQHARLPLLLEPLDVEHAEPWFHQFRDTQIAQMTGLPAFENVAAVRDWILQHLASEDRRSYAAIHRDEGFAGYASLHVSGNAANFSFWIGVDFQGRGWGAALPHMICDEGFPPGVRWIFASAFNDNLRSIRALEVAGFQRLEVRPADPDDDRTFLYRSSEPASDDDAVQALRDYLDREAANVPLVATDPLIPIFQEYSA